jgi:hypothetical protein
VTYFNENFKLRNNIDFEIQNLSMDLKRKEIEKYNHLHYAFGYKLKCKPWLTYEEIYAITG